jgi:hypothetical protein
MSRVQSALAVRLPVHGRAEIVLAPIPRLIYSFLGYRLFTRRFPHARSAAPGKEDSMLKKSYSKTGTLCRVTFKYENEEQAASGVLAGEFNDWSLTETPMKKLKDGSFSVTLSLPVGHRYCFRYVLDGNIWVNDTEPDGYAPNEYGEANSVLTL